MLRRLFGGNNSAATIQHSNAAELKTLLDGHDNLFLVDVRSPREYQYDGHIPGTTLIPLPELATRIAELPQNQTIVCVCRSGSRSRSACQMLAQQGFGDLVNLKGGMFGWQRAGFPVE